MSTKLSDSNPYLRDPTLRQRSVLVSVATSSAIEGIRAPLQEEGIDRKAGSKESQRHTQSCSRSQSQITVSHPLQPLAWARRVRAITRRKTAVIGA